MEIYGNIDGLKQAIEKKYADEIKKIEDETSSIIKQLEKESNNKISLKKSRISTLTNAEIRKATSKISSEENLKAKKEFEQKREDVINQVFDMAFKKAVTIAHSRKYIDFLKKNMPNEAKKYEITADSDFYKEYFPEAKINIDNTIIGIKFRVGEITYDFTLDGAIKSQKDILRNKVSKTIFD